MEHTKAPIYLLRSELLSTDRKVFKFVGLALCYSYTWYCSAVFNDVSERFFPNPGVTVPPACTCSEACDA